MRIYSNKDFSWKDKKLYLGRKFIGEVFQTEDDLSLRLGYMYSIKWKDGMISADHYNLSRAKDNLVQYTISSLNRIPKVTH